VSRRPLVSLLVAKGLSSGVTPRLLRLTRLPIVERGFNIRLGQVQIRVRCCSAARCFRAMNFRVGALGRSHDLLFLAHCCCALSATGARLIAHIAPCSCLATRPKLPGRRGPASTSRWRQLN
jgi:hypothetical protein